MGSNGFRILVVCRGNVCQSSVVELLLSQGLASIRPGYFKLLSAGIFAEAGADIEPGSAEIVQAYGGDPAGFAARRLNRTDILASDLIMAMTVEQRSVVLQAVPSKLKNVFTLREFGRMLEHLSIQSSGLASGHEDADDWRRVVARAGLVRHLTLAEDPRNDDVIDPYGQSEKIYRQMEGEIIPALNSIVGYAFGKV